MTYRELFDAVMDYEGPDLHSDVVQPWLATADEERRWLEDFGKRRGAPIPEASVEDLWRLYALSRVAEVLRLRIDAAPFMEALGLRRIERAEFHPFFHEIVTVGDEPKELWPGYMLGPLLIARAGRAAAGDFVKEIAEHSTLYWAYARDNRPTEDLSRGWGSNSQWRTLFRRDYELEGVLHYNVDARPSPRPLDEDLDPSERLELLRHRCFVKCPKPHADRWPYYDTYREEAVS